MKPSPNQTIKIYHIPAANGKGSKKPPIIKAIKLEKGTKLNMSSLNILRKQQKNIEIKPKPEPSPSPGPGASPGLSPSPSSNPGPSLSPSSNPGPSPSPILIPVPGPAKEPSLKEPIEIATSSAPKILL